MKNIITFFLLALATFCAAQSNQVKTPGVSYSAGAPNWVPVVKTASELAIDTVAKRMYLWNRNTGAWDLQGQGIDNTSGGTPPAYTPGQTDSKFAINNASPPELYAWTGSAWAKVGGTIQTIDTFSVTGSVVSLSLSQDNQPAKTITLPASGITALTGDVTATGPGSAVATIATASASVRGLLSSADWNTFNGKLGGSGTLNYLPKFTGASALGNSLLFDNSTQVGFNTNSPEATFHVKKSDVSGSASGGSFGFLIEDGITNAVFGIQTDASRYGEIVFGDQGGLARGGLRYSLTSRSTNRRQLQFFTNGFGSSSMVIDSTSKVGVNNSAPESQLHVIQTDVSGTFPTGYAFGLEHNSDDVVMAMKTNSIRSNRIWFGDNTNNNLGGIFYYGSTHGTLPNHMQFWTNGAQRTWLDETGRFGIGVDPAARLHVQGAGATSANNALQIQNSTPSTLYNIRNDGQISFWATNTATGTTGAQTISRPSGTVNFLAGTSSLVVTNTLVTTSSIVFAVVRTNDTTATIKNVVPGAGSFTITLTAAATAETSVGFFVIN